MVDNERSAPERLPTGVPGLDLVTRGGLLTGGIYLVVGRPGAGKTILGNQIAFGHIARKGRVVYATLLSETHTRLISQIKNLTFFEEAAIGKDLVYLNALAPLQAEGLDGLLRSIQKMVREQRAELLVLDGLLPPAQLGVDELAYKQFVAALQSWVGVMGCTVLILRTGAIDGAAASEQTMVDGILELGQEMRGLRTLRQLAFTKLRGSAFAEGRHSYRITEGGLQVYPRLEAVCEADESKLQPYGELVATGVRGLDPLVGGGLVPGSTTLLLGPSGAGKSIACLHFLAEGLARGQRCVYFGFYEPPHALLQKAARLGIELEPHFKSGQLQISWRNPAEAMLDRNGHELLALVKQHGAVRLALDGFAGFRTADHPERISSAFTVLTNDMSRSGVTTMVTDETRELFVREVEVPTQHVSALFHNIVFLRCVEMKAELLRLIGIMKTRDTDHDRRLFEFTIDERGMNVLAPFRADDRGLMGGGDGTPPWRPEPTPKD